MQGQKTAEKGMASYVELHICGRILIISASISTVIGLLMSARLYVLDIPFNNFLTINESVLSVRLFIFIFKTNSCYIRFGSIWRVGIFCQINKVY
jgi:hypothetical protein